MDEFAQYANLMPKKLLYDLAQYPTNLSVIVCVPSQTSPQSGIGMS